METDRGHHPGFARHDKFAGGPGSLSLPFNCDCHSRVVGIRRAGPASSEANQGMQNQALEQTRDSVLRYGESVGCELLNFFVRRHLDGMRKS